MKSIFFSLVLAFGLMSPMVLEAKAELFRHNVKFIDLSWSNPTVDQYVKNLSMLEKTCPADGLVIEFYGKKRMVDGKEFIPGSRTPMGKIPWKYEDFKEEIAKYKSVKSKKFTHNFFYTVPRPGKFDWRSDSDWASIANNYGIAARIARETGMKGILFDLEQYGEKFWLPKYDQMSESYEEICRIARKRGQEWGKAVFGAYPDIVVFGLTMFSSHGYTRVLRPFFNGIMDVMPPTATLIDGHETEGYTAHCQADYDRMFVDKYRHFVKYAEPENRIKYYTQVKLAPAFYMDAILLNRPGKWRDKYLNVSPDEDLRDFLRRNLFSAIRSSDDYIWLYSEHGCWRDPKNKFFKQFEKLYPGVTQVVEDMRAPENIDLTKLNNLVGRNNLKSSLGTWKFWQIQEDQKGAEQPGMAFAENGIIYMQGVTHGAIHHRFDTKPGKFYLIRAKMRHEKGSSGTCRIAVGYRNSKGQWLTKTDKSDHWELYTSTNGKWVDVVQVIRIPEDVNAFSVHLGGGGMRKNDTVAFRDIFIGELPRFSKEK